MCTGQKELSETLPRLQETLLGWIVGGELIDSRVISNKLITILIKLSKLIVA